MIMDEQVRRFLHSRGVEPTGVVITRLDGGEINDNWLIETAGEAWVLRHYRRTWDPQEAFLAYELGALVSNFGKDLDRRVDVDRVLELIMAYDAVRPLTGAERSVLPELLTAHAGCDAIRVLSTWIAGGRDDINVLDSYSARELLDLHLLNQELHAALGT
ncbi:hypothetical protein FOE78_17475 [Microlunatus elymi]|uniref:Phosphotransferase enzyme family protein n=1 Tax=Microlunatus elymi TaxID=2596828 RepID=A0A516Q219_9ACTN|nr:hypothetical protein [Microlunatus elymi]QDP97467.1 hypothetical protein FOE78_17475 [Microlunatus elymi]